MERRQPAKIICLFLLIIFYPLSYCCCKTWQVKKNSTLNSIGDAVNRAQPFDTIIVFGGIYFEKNLCIRKPLFISGIENPVLDGEKKFEIISVYSSYVTIEGFELRHSGKSSMNDIAGIKVYFSKNVTVRNNILNDMFFAIYFQECNNCTVAGNRITSSGSTEVQSGNGIHCWKSDSMLVSTNTISGQRDGIYFEFVTNSTIENNFSNKNIRYGLHFMFSHHNTYSKNIFQNNGAGVAVMYTHNVTMVNNTFNDNWGAAAYGLLMKDISDSRVEENKFLNNTIGIYMEGSSRIEIKNNNFANNGCALRIQASCDDNIIEKNNFKLNTFDVNTNGSLVLNTFKNNYWDKYEGYDLNHDGIGDVPYHPVSMYSMIIDRIPVAIIFLRSFLVTLLDKTEKSIPSITPEIFKDASPFMKPFAL